MTRNEDIQEIDIDELPEDPWDEITLHLIHDSKIDLDFANANAQKCGRKKRKDRWMSIANEIPNLILQLQQQHLRERSLKLLSDFLLQKREEDPDNYHSTAYLLYNSCSTMTILLQELLAIFGMMVDGSLTARASMRVVNVLTLFQ
ncbi:CCR4-NOT transcription complex subunit 9-like isoform X3, partial [Fagus crenata]